jgi:hypothetical protein
MPDESSISAALDRLQLNRDEQVRKTKVFSFDVLRMKRDVAQGDTLALVIRAHLYVEHILLQMLTESFVVSTTLDLRRLTFPMKVDLCVALGLLGTDWRGVIGKLNEVRNQAAHRLGVQLGDDQRHELWSLLPTELKTELLSDTGNADAVPLERIFQFLIILTDIQRQNAAASRIDTAYRREYFRLASENARKVLNNLNVSE